MYIVNLKEQISNTFTQCLTNNCLEDINSSSFEVVDDKQNSPCRSLTDGKFGQFKIENPDKYLLHFLKIDHCILFEQDGKKCDFAVFNADELIFVELKTIEKNSSNEHGKRNQKKRDAYIQLENTLETFKNEKIDLSSYQ
ncbi:MAG: hypothetical protein KAH84_12385, partial [Thiomargarita sp.]|nr:hypothetical protein [Thiomargarita sp.]